MQDLPIPSTVQKFNEAEYFFVQMLENYHHPFRFQFNLNAFLQALRNITFMLQSEKNKPQEVLEWYASKQNEMKSNKILKKINEARVIVVHQSSLTYKSKAWIGIFRWRKIKVGLAYSIPVYMDSLVALKLAKDVFGFIDKKDYSDEQIGIQRIWKVKELGDEEICSLCLNALNYMGCLVSEALSLYGVDVDYSDSEINIEEYQILLESDINPIIFNQWNI